MNARRHALRLAAILGLTLMAGAAQAQGAAGVTGVPALDQLLPAGNGAASGRILQLVALLTVLSLAPGLLVMVTSFTRFSVALSFLRSGLGLQSTPANLFLVSLSLFMTFYVMAPTFDRAWGEGVKPLQENRITEEEAYGKIVEPFRAEVLDHLPGRALHGFAMERLPNLRGRVREGHPTRGQGAATRDDGEGRAFGHGRGYELAVLHGGGRLVERRRDPEAHLARRSVRAEKSEGASAEVRRLVEALLPRHGLEVTLGRVLARSARTASASAFVATRMR